MENNSGFSESFLLGLLAGFGGLITVIFNAMRKSRCSTVNCCGSSCTRSVLSEKEILEEIKLENQV
jgi:hypothetical protein